MIIITKLPKENCLLNGWPLRALISEDLPQPVMFGCLVLLFKNDANAFHVKSYGFV